jgi:hypothetical protein
MKLFSDRISWLLERRSECEREASWVGEEKARWTSARS